MFNHSPIKTAFEKRGFTFGAVPGVRLPQRRFTDKEERQKVLSLLHDRGLDTSEWEDCGKHHADLFIAAPPKQFSHLLACMSEMRLVRNRETEGVGYLRR
jgi:hypothetical protein